VAIRRLLTDPVDLGVAHAAKPVGLEAEQVAIERIFEGAIVDKKPDMDDVPAYGVGSLKRLEGGRRLNELDFIAFGILDGEPAAAICAFFHLPRHLPGLRSKIAAHGFGIVRVPCGVIEAVDA
jgi:hypothetical protein